MQINKYNVSSPNFGALQIDRCAISGLSEYECKKLCKAGEDLKDTKVYDLQIWKGGLPVITDGDIFFKAPIGVEKPDGNIFKFTAHTQYSGSKSSVFAFPLANAKMASEAYDNMLLTCKSALDKAIELTKILEESAQFQRTECIKRKEAEIRLQEMKQDLYEKYGI